MFRIIIKVTSVDIVYKMSNLNNPVTTEWVDIYKDDDVKEIIGKWRRIEDGCIKTQLKMYDAHPMIDLFSVLVHQSAIINAIVIKYPVGMKVLEVTLRNDRNQNIIHQEIPDDEENSQKEEILLEFKSGGGLPVVPVLHIDFNSVKNKKLKFDVKIDSESRVAKKLPEIFVFYQEDVDISDSDSNFSSDSEDEERPNDDYLIM